LSQEGIKAPTEAQWYVNTEKSILDQIADATDPQVKAELTQRLAGFKRSFADAKGKGEIDEATKAGLKMLADETIKSDQLGETIAKIRTQMGISQSSSAPQSGANPNGWGTAVKVPGGR
jgi:hypothetical protein